MSVRPLVIPVLSIWISTLLATCSQLVAPEKEPRCVVRNDVDPCPEGSACLSGHCMPQSCDDNDLCGDQIDNDCDGRTDEGHDADGDGVPWCGDLAKAETRDCDDLNPLVSPLAQEACDGLDNDCDMLTDEAPAGGSLCEEGKLCLAGQCAAPSCASGLPATACAERDTCIDDQCVPTGCSENSCQPGTRCDPASGVCVREEKRANGQSCSRSSDCLSDQCADSATMRFPGDDRICVQACCADRDCPSGQLCVASGSGARSCLPKEPYQGLGQQCTQTCPAGQLCAIDRYPQVAGSQFAAYTTSVCITDRDPLADTLGAPCFLDAECASQICVPSDGSTFWGFCSMPCGSTADCAPFAPRSTTRDRAPVTYCRYLRADNILFGVNSKDNLSVCVISRGEVGSRGIGEPCRSGEACQDGACVGASADNDGTCAPTCCKDEQCRTTGSSTARCVAVPRGADAYEMRCIDNITIRSGQ